MINRYIFFRKLFPKFVIVFELEEKKRSIGLHKNLLKYLKNDDINYLVVRNDWKVTVVEREQNNYDYYLIKDMLYSLLGRRMSDK